MGEPAPDPSSTMKLMAVDGTPLTTGSTESSNGSFLLMQGHVLMKGHVVVQAPLFTGALSQRTVLSQRRKLGCEQMVVGEWLWANGSREAIV